MKKQKIISLSRNEHKAKSKTKLCNLCAEEYIPRNIFERYCQTCKTESELLKFSEWLPEIDAAISERLDPPASAALKRDLEFVA